MDFEIFFSDLTPEAQERFLKYMEMGSAEEGNYDVFPIAVLDYNTKPEYDELTDPGKLYDDDYSDK